ncbi:LOW QUALITY PROTEIN: hypothetical protein M514_11626 [Trichuris suis]|uniref:Uncharacterized protein n=1 Tax=Trichuris suis TaxID=68888 RepID=A0A085N394_9BILA|nr:LOW QUALITY PROTEIN: hypothetical protein M513_11626 [Trichuris suis]KFD63940.1 LOW QUALITY PROTEIN: hypothetical protein M514_11626 [Trichuris suis]
MAQEVTTYDRPLHIGDNKIPAESFAETEVEQQRTRAIRSYASAIDCDELERRTSGRMVLQFVVWTLTCELASTKKGRPDERSSRRKRRLGVGPENRTAVRPRVHRLPENRREDGICEQQSRIWHGRNTSATTGQAVNGSGDVVIGLRRYVGVKTACLTPALALLVARWLVGSIPNCSRWSMSPSATQRKRQLRW